jgi:endonuclease/exonuclease/phosphatase family metal-dependent hydrolase
MRKMFFLLSIVLFLAIACPAQELKVMTYNIRFDNPADGVNAWPNRKTRVFDLLKEYDPDILGVQEALEHQIKEIIVAIPEYDFIGVGRDDGKTKGEYSAILYKKSKFSIYEPATFWLSENPTVPGSKNWDAAITRVVTWAKFKAKDSQKEFYVLNTHFDHIGKEARKNSAEIIRKKTEDLKGAPVIITGDFNCTRQDDPYKTIMKKGPVSLIDPAPENAPGTYCTFVVNGPECNPIDYIFHTPQWKSSDYKVITDNDGKHYPSDHLPVMVKLQLTGK